MKTPPTNQQLCTRLRAIAKKMIELGVDLEYYGGLSQIAEHGRQMVGAGHIAISWADAIENEESERVNETILPERKTEGAQT